MVKISAFADEIGDDLDFQISQLKANGVGWIELRGVWGKNVMALSPAEIREVKLRASDAGIGFSAVGSPLGKFPLDGDFSVQIEGVKKALEFAQILEAPYIRMFSFWIPDGENPATHRPQVIDWLGQLIAQASTTPIVLAHENEKGIYGDTGERCLDLYSSLSSPSFTGIFDFANFVQCGEKPYRDCWQKLRPFITYFHVKDALLDSGKVVPAGQGDGDVAKILSEAFQAGFDNFLTLEPHLSVAETSYGRTTPELFGTASKALFEILNQIK
ncbi:MAG: sugar phosphate isomerase/epimerase [Anaerolineaceae bacterium]|nr:sugar phosphate isomerase/epimerase [Anaerolineaceae bacterium]